jgi:hypothetical protein
VASGSSRVNGKMPKGVHPGDNMTLSWEEFMYYARDKLCVS